MERDSTNPNAPLFIAKVGRPHGIRGANRVFPLDEQSTSLEYVASVQLGFEGQPPSQSFEIAEIEWADRFYRLRFDGIETRDAAAKLVGACVYIDRSQLPEGEDDLYVCDLIGCEIVDQAGCSRGRVVDTTDNGAQDILVFRGNDRHTIMMPFVDHYVIDVDIVSRKIIVDTEHCDSLTDAYRPGKK